jgi:hypothetical protein
VHFHTVVCQNPFVKTREGARLEVNQSEGRQPTCLPQELGRKPRTSQPRGIRGPPSPLPTDQPSATRPTASHRAYWPPFFRPADHDTVAMTPTAAS